MDIPKVGDNRISATFNSRIKAKSLSHSLINQTNLSHLDIKLVPPSDNAHALSEKLEGDSEELGKSMLLYHGVFGALGLIAGLALATLLLAIGPAWATQNPMFIYIALLSPGLGLGLFLSGLLSLRPERDAVNMETKTATLSGNWTVLVEMKDGVEKSRVMSLIKENGPMKII